MTTQLPIIIGLLVAIVTLGVWGGQPLVATAFNAPALTPQTQAFTLVEITGTGG
jgi:hypothetical protein